ncbi:MAG: hypothetical protein WBA10_04210 [Elainellaceae cyanobacterium]
MTRTSTHRAPAFVSACLILLLSGLAVGCGSDGDPGAESSSPESTAVDGASPPAADGTATPDAPAANADQSTKASPPATPAASVQGQDVLCSTPSQTAQITWDQGEPRLSITRKPNQPVLNQASPVAIQRNDDSSVTYGYLQDTTAYIKTLSDGNCMVQILDAQGGVTVEEYGRTS